MSSVSTSLPRQDDTTKSMDNLPFSDKRDIMTGIGIDHIPEWSPAGQCPFETWRRRR
jgi:hypothetical protein